MRILLFWSLFLVLPFTAHALSYECQSALESLFKNQVSKEEARQFMKLQGDITLHRLAWTYMRARTDMKEKNLKSVERTIIELLNEKYTNSDPAFIKARETFESQPLSRAALADIAPYLKEALSATYKEDEEIFRLNTSDLKVLSAIAKFERTTAKNGIYDHRMLSTKSPEGILNFVKLINSSYKTKLNPDEQAYQNELQLKGIEAVLEELQNKLNSFLDTLEVPPDCVTKCNCPKDIKMGEFMNDDVQKIFWASLADDLESDDTLLGNLSYGDLWPRVSKGQGQIPKRTVPAPKTLVSAGVMVEDPIAVIQKDSQTKNIDKTNTDFNHARAAAILADEKIFEFEGKLYDRKTGKVVTPLEAMEALPPAARQAAIAKWKTVIPSFEIPLTLAQVNGKESFVHNGNLYDLSGKKLNPENVIADVMGKKLGITISSERYKDQKEFLTNRAHALKNNMPYFKSNGISYDSLTGTEVSSPFRSIAVSDSKIEKEKRKMFEKLSDADLVRNFHRDNPDPNCGYYGIIDKSSASIKVYKNDGSVIFQSEVLIGAEKSDKRTRWTEYSDKVRTPSSSTGAGIFTIRPQNLNDSYNKKNFDNKILSFQDENKKDTVFAIHQVPLNLRARYTRFNTGDPEDRRISGGCANVKLEDFEKMKKWLAPSCKVYVLPEEEGNKFIVEDKKLKFVSTEPVPMNRLNLYNFSSHDTEPKSINIRIVDKSADTQAAREFVKALAEEKTKLMQMYNLSNDEYNDLALVAFGILGNESDFGKSGRLHLKENAQVAVIAAKWMRDRDLEKAKNTSRGLTQIKMLPGGELAKEYPEINKDNLMNPRNAAVATMAYLVDAAKQMRKIAISNNEDTSKLRITRENMMDYLGYLYQGRKTALTSEDPSKQATPEYNAYYRNLQRNMTYIEISQRTE